MNEEDADESGDVRKISSCCVNTRVPLPGSTKSPTISSTEDDEETCTSEERKLLVTEDILWVVNPIGSTTFLRQIDFIGDDCFLLLQVLGFMDFEGVVVVGGLNSKLRTKRPFERVFLLDDNIYNVMIYGDIRGYRKI